MGTVPIVEPDQRSGDSTAPALSPAKSIPVGLPKPKRLIQYESRRRLRVILLDGRAEDVLCVGLDLVVDRERDVPARLLGLLAQKVDGAPERILDDGLAPRHAGKHVVEGAFEPVQAVVVDPG